jgi:hypothetical protein
MSVSIDEMQVETQAPAAASGGQNAGAAPQPETNLEAELERLHERKLRLQAD